MSLKISAKVYQQAVSKFLGSIPKQSIKTDSSGKIKNWSDLDTDTKKDIKSYYYKK